MEEKKTVIEDKEVQKLKDIGLDKISNKTFINKENLTLVLDREFHKLEKTKCLGFIKILEREYDVDLSELKRDYLDYQMQHKKDNEVESYVRIKEDEFSVSNNKNYILIATTAIASIALLWWLFSKDTNENIQEVQDDLNIVKNTQVTVEAQQNLSFLNTSKTKNTNEDDILNSSLTDDNLSTTSEDEEYPEEVDLNKVVEEMFKEQNNSQKENNNSDNKSQKNIIENNSSNQTEKNNTSTVLETKTKKDINTEEDKDIKPIKNKIKNKTIPTSFSILPTEKAWVGIFYLDERKKKSYLKKADSLLELDPTRDQLIVVGHRNFKIFSDSDEFKFKSRAMVRFSYINGELKEINRAKYNELSGGIVW